MYLNITSSTALNSGAQLWFVPKRNHSFWTPKIDWYLGFQFTKNLNNKIPSIPEKLQKILKTNKLEELSSSSKKDLSYPIFIVPQKTFPTDLVVKFNSDLRLEIWIEEVKQIWKNLKQPSLRIFLPEDTSEEEFLKNWNEEDVQLGIVASKK